MAERQQPELRMTVRVAAPKTAALIEFLEESGCLARPVEPGIVQVTLPAARRADAAELELDLYLRVWEARTGQAAVLAAGEADENQPAANRG